MRWLDDLLLGTPPETLVWLVMLACSLPVVLVVVGIVVLGQPHERIAWRELRIAVVALTLASVVASALLGVYLISLLAAVLLLAILAATPYYRHWLERPQVQRARQQSAKSGTSLILFLRAFKYDWITAELQRVLHTSTNSAFPRPGLNPGGLWRGHFTVKTLALGLDDGQGFPKLETTDAEWLSYLTSAVDNAVAVFVVPLFEDADDAASGLARELAYLLWNAVERTIVVMPRQPHAGSNDVAVDLMTAWRNAQLWCAASPQKLMLPAYDPLGRLVTLHRNGNAVLCARTFALSHEGIVACLDFVTAKARLDHKKLYEDWRQEFRALNGGVDPQDYYARDGKKAPPNLPA